MPNRLQQETSPYLLQHADNPVHWHAWNEEALEAAKQSRKPILLSIGYSACHWCHVMAHESFEDNATASLMNELFVNIKVDREERPDLDKIYQTAHQLITRRAGGWPLTVFLTPDDHLPIFAGTYFPNEPRHGMPSFQEVVRRVADYYRENEDDVRNHGRALREALASLNAPPGTEALTRKPLQLARERLAASFDSEYGGFGDAPKFPHPTNIETLLMGWRVGVEDAKPDRDALDMATMTLTRMANGGLYDQLGGGFYRYSVDRYWLIPHFEKMLYDNAGLLAAYSQASAATGEALFGKIAAETAGWVMREMQDREGAYYATLDADSEGEEGKYYIWTPEQFESILDADETAVASRHYGLTRAANFEGAWHLHAAEPLDEVAQAQGLALDRAEALLDAARSKLFNARTRRARPGRDEKVLVSWNGLMVGAMAVAARHSGDERTAASASRAVDFIRSTMWRDGRLNASYKDGRARFSAYLDDYAFLAHGLLELLQCRWRVEDLTLARELIEVLLAHFEDEAGGFFFTADDHETLIHRPKPFADEATPSGNGIAVQVLTVLGHLLGETRYLDAADRALHAAWPAIERYPEAHNTLLRGLDDLLTPPEIIVIRGDPLALGEWRRLVHAGYHPKRYSFIIPSEATDLPDLLAERRPQGRAVAYLCEGTQCRAPITSLEGLVTALGSTAGEKNHRR